jgi:hypothetical protein
MSAKRKKRRERKLLRQHRVGPKRFWAPPGELQEVDEPDRLAYTRKQAAEALGVSVSTIDRRVVPLLSTVKTPWGQRLIPRPELQRFLREHVEPPREPGERGRAGRPPTLPRGSSSGSVCSTRAGTASPRSLAPSTTTVSRPRTAAGSGGRQRSGPCLSAQARSRPLM